MLALPIFPCSHPQSIVGANELNFCVRDGNRWTLIAINTNYSEIHVTLCSAAFRRLDRSTNFFLYFTSSSPICQGLFPQPKRTGDPYRIRTDVKGVRGLCLNHLTNGPCFPRGAPSRTRTGDPLIKSQLLYQLS